MVINASEIPPESALACPTPNVCITSKTLIIPNTVPSSPIKGAMPAIVSMTPKPRLSDRTCWRPSSSINTLNSSGGKSRLSIQPMAIREKGPSNFSQTERTKEKFSISFILSKTAIISGTKIFFLRNTKNRSRMMVSPMMEASNSGYIIIPPLLKISIIRFLPKNLLR